MRTQTGQRLSGDMKRMGKFTVAGQDLRARDINFLESLMDGVVVYHMEHRVDLDVVTYYAYHPQFDEIEDGEEYPEYEFYSRFQDATFPNGIPSVAFSWRRK